ncbi:formate dehydrogenase subunit gamma [Sulfuriferula sp. GW1]|uniref:formate dehydrogenase subunit gamma n=1 Tax=Sulfuriferula sp. GW1 TaxID=3345111 RepID=UPI0039AF18D3
MSKRPYLIERYPPSDRFNHWFVAITFILVALSGLALFHPAFFFLSHLLGGGPWTRILHPFIGVVMFVAFLVLALRFWGHNFITGNDRQWLRQMDDVVTNQEEKLPAVGRYNAGQKLFFWTMVICIVLLLITGILIWQPYFAPYVPIVLIRVAVLVHALSAFVAITGLIIHIYAAIWVKGSVGAMTRGTVTEAWARQHHLDWYRKIKNGEMRGHDHY